MLILPTAQGCFYFLPFIEVEQNVPPTIEYSSPGAGETLVFQTEQYVAFVVAEDLNGAGDLTFLWSIDSFGVRADAVPVQAGENQLGSQLTLARDVAFDGHVLTVQVTDPAGETAMLQWPIQVPEVSP
ncbi:hypothetical protein L6R53_04405 [Myxococcota bacterium]|nr:hypothetical protein [Myxococcota bacterium]